MKELEMGKKSPKKKKKYQYHLIRTSDVTRLSLYGSFTPLDR